VLVAVPLVAAMASVRALADQQGRDELVRRIGEDEVGRVSADVVPEAKLLHARLYCTREGERAANAVAMSKLTRFPEARVDYCGSWLVTGSRAPSHRFLCVTTFHHPPTKLFWPCSLAGPLRLFGNEFTSQTVSVRGLSVNPLAALHIVALNRVYCKVFL
jgi:hypothetical protein